MAGWFSRMTRGAEGPEAEPVEYSVVCGCGNSLKGTRSRKMQVAVCRKCASQVCVLPVSPYPRPKLRAPKKKPVKPYLKPLRELNSDEIELVTPVPTSRRTGSKTTPKPANRPGKTGSKSTFKPKWKSSRPDEKPLDSPDEFVPNVPRAKIVTPLRLISLGMIGVIFLAGWWTLHRRAVHNAALTFADTARSGRAALAKYDYDAANEQFQKAVKALDLLGREDREARQIRQLARETTASNGLSSTSLFELISESRQTKTMSPGDWLQALTRTYRGTWFLFDTNALQFDSNGGKAQWKFLLPLMPGEDPILVRGDLSKWGKLLGDKPPIHVVFAGQVEEIIPTAQGVNGWEIVLNGDTLVLWTDADTYRALGGVLDEGSVAALKSQSQLLGVAE